MRCSEKNAAGERQREREVKLLREPGHFCRNARGSERARRRKGRGWRLRKCVLGLQQQPPPAWWPPWLLDSVELVVGCWGPILIPLAWVDTNTKRPKVNKKISSEQEKNKASMSPLHACGRPHYFFVHFILTPVYLVQAGHLFYLRST